jgi:hypothetical protein
MRHCAGRLKVRIHRVKGKVVSRAARQGKKTGWSTRSEMKSLGSALNSLL